MNRPEEALREATLRSQQLLDEVAEGGEPDSLLRARAELNRLADGWRTLLRVHERDDDGRCQACPGLIRRRRWPCHVWLLAHRHLVDDAPAHLSTRRPPSRRRRDAPLTSDTR